MAKPYRPRPFLSIVIPAFNESRRLAPALEQICRYVERTSTSAEVIVVDDGSSDHTAEVVERVTACPVPVQLLRNRINRGKGYSVRRGMRRAAGEILLMTDADQSTPLWEIEKALPYFEVGFDVVIGSRDMDESEVEAQPLVRRVMGKILRLVRGWLMLKDISDTQCGFKAFTHEAGKRIFAAQVEDGFAFDCEVLMLARRMGYRVKEIGVVWCDDRDSRVRPIRDSIRMIVSLLKIRWRFRHEPGGGAAESRAEA